MSKVKLKIRKGKGKEEETTAAVKVEEGTGLLCCVPSGAGKMCPENYPRINKY